MWGPLLIRFLDVVMFFVNKWAATEAEKAKWKAAVDAAREEYRRTGVYSISKLKRDYDELQKDLKDGKWKV